MPNPSFLESEMNVAKRKQKADRWRVPLEKRELEEEEEGKGLYFLGIYVRSAQYRER